MADNIVLIGLVYDDNLGDQAIAFSSKNIIEEYLYKKGIKADLRLLDLQGRKKCPDNEQRKENIIIGFAKRLMPKLLHYIADFKIFKSFKKIARHTIDTDTKAIIFIGGGIIKFKQQFFPKPIAFIIQMAELYKIPVMFSGVGVEGFDVSDNRCLRIKNSINSDVVKVITTRDDIECLQKNYITNKSKKVAKVADSACCICDYTEKVLRNDDVIGLGIASPALFSRYGKSISEEELMSLWIKIYIKLKNMGFKVKLFTNGAVDDYEFAKKVSHEIGDSNILESRPTILDDLITQISGYKAIIATRMHSNIIAYYYRIPAVGIVWNNKQLMFGKSINREKYYFSDKDLNVQKIVDSLIDFIHEGYDESSRHEYVMSTKKHIYSFLDSYL